MPYLNKRNRFIQAAKQFADTANNGNPAEYNRFTKTELLAIAQSINMKGIPTWVLKECNSPAKGLYDLTHLFRPVTTTV